MCKLVVLCCACEPTVALATLIARSARRSLVPCLAQVWWLTRFSCRSSLLTLDMSVRVTSDETPQEIVFDGEKIAEWFRFDRQVLRRAKKLFGRYGDRLWNGTTVKIDDDAALDRTGVVLSWQVQLATVRTHSGLWCRRMMMQHQGECATSGDAATGPSGGQYGRPWSL